MSPNGDSSAIEQAVAWRRETVTQNRQTAARKRTKYPPGQGGKVRRLYDQSREFFEELSDVDFAESPVPSEYERVIDRMADGWTELRDRLIAVQERPKNVSRIDEWSAG